MWQLRHILQLISGSESQWAENAVPYVDFDTSQEIWTRWNLLTNCLFFPQLRDSALYLMTYFICVLDYATAKSTGVNWARHLSGEKVSWKKKIFQVKSGY